MAIGGLLDPAERHPVVYVIAAGVSFLKNTALLEHASYGFCQCSSI